MTATREALAPATLDATPSEALYAKLSPGPGRSAGEVALHQRARIHSAMVAIVSDRGYDAVTVRELARLAGVSTRTFYEHFEGKEQCLLRTIDLIAQRAAGNVLMAQKDQHDWQERLRLALLSFAREVKRRPRMARLALVDAGAAGPPALLRLRRVEHTFGEMVADSFERAPDGAVVPPAVIEGIVAGIASVARSLLLKGHEDELPGLADELTEWALCYRSKGVEGLAKAGLDTWLPSLEAVKDPSEADTSEQALGDERALILSAVAKLVAAEGCAQLTIPRIRAVAGVSRQTYDANFQNVQECCAAAFAQHAGEALRSGASAYAEDGPWPESVHRGMVELCVHIANDPVLIQLGFAEISSLGAEGIATRERLLSRMAELLLESAPRESSANRLTAEASVGAVWGVIHHQVTSGEAQRLPEAAPTLSYLTLAPAIGATAAMDAIRQVASPIETSTINRTAGQGS